MHERIVELEEVVGPLVNRQRGGRGGGGSLLSTEAWELVTRFERLQAECERLADIEETIFAGTVTATSSGFATIDTAAGSLEARLFGTADAVQVSVRADRVTLHAASGPAAPPAMSTQNRFQGTVTEVSRRDNPGTVTIDVGAETLLQASVRQTSIDEFDLREGRSITASFSPLLTYAVPDHRCNDRQRHRTTADP